MISPSTRLRRALHLRSLSLTRRIILSNPNLSDLIRNPDPSDRNNTSLHLAATLGLVEIAEFLLAHGHEEPGISRNLDGVTPLMVAAQAGNDEEDETSRASIEVGKLIISHYPDCTLIRDKGGMDAFSHASKHGTLPIIQALLSLPYPSDPVLNLGDLIPPPSTSTIPQNPLLSSRDNQGNTPLHQASAAGQLKTLRLFISLGADHTARNNAHWTPIDYSASVSAEVYLRGLVREREGSRTTSNIATAQSGGLSAGYTAIGQEVTSKAADARRTKGKVRLVQSEDEDSDTGAEARTTGHDRDGVEVVRGRARTAT